MLLPDQSLFQRQLFVEGPVCGELGHNLMLFCFIGLVIDCIKELSLPCCLLEVSPLLNFADVLVLYAVEDLFLQGLTGLAKKSGDFGCLVCSSFIITQPGRQELVVLGLPHGSLVFLGDLTEVEMRLVCLRLRTQRVLVQIRASPLEALHLV